MISERQLAIFAAEAFDLGLVHGRRLSKPLDAGQVLARLGFTGRYRPIERTKLRQVYGAGFDLATPGRWR